MYKIVGPLSVKLDNFRVHKMDMRLQFSQFDWKDFEKSVIPGLLISLPCSVESMLLMSYSIQST